MNRRAVREETGMSERVDEEREGGLTGAGASGIVRTGGAEGPAGGGGGEIGRRGFVAAALAAGAVAASVLRPSDGVAASGSTVPHGRPDPTIAPAVIQAERMKGSIACAIDLTSVRETAGGHLQMELFFDRYEEGKSVREVTDEVEKLSLVHQELHRPPVCLVTWGTGLAFKCILESVRTGFAMFLADGTPVRASCLVDITVPDR
jgi:hypothetical protein